MTKIRHLFFTLLLIAAAFSPNNAFAKSYTFEDHIIERIDVRIMSQTDEFVWNGETIRNRLCSREGDFFSQAQFDTDLKNLAQDFDRIEPNVDIIDGNVHISLMVWPKPLIRNIYIHGNEKVKTSKLLSELNIPSCSVFDRVTFHKAFHELKNFYVKKGYFEIELDYQLERDPETCEVDIHIQVSEGRAGKIRKIVFCNFTKEEKNTVLCMMVTKHLKPIISWMTGEGTYNEDAMQHDKLQIVNYLQNQGYSDAQVEVDILEDNRCDDKIIIQITADKGPRYYLGDICFDGHTLYSADEIRREILVCPGEPYSPEKLIDTTRSIMNLYGRCGYIDTVVNFIPKLRDDACIYDISIDIEEGEQFRVGLIKVFGNCATKTKVILHETLLMPGELFNLEKLERTERRLRNMGYFKNVNVYAVRSEGLFGLAGNYRDVHIEVEEDSTGHFGAFFGFSSAENMFGGINITEKNFDHCGLSSLFTKGTAGLRGGGEYLSLNTNIGQKSRSIKLSWTQPYFRDTKWAVGFDIEKSNNQYMSDHYDIDTLGLTLHASYQCNPFVRLGYHYRIYYSDIDIHTHKDDKTKREQVTEQIKEAERADGIISAVGTHIAYDSTNHPVEPTCGFRSRLEAEYAGIGGKHYFTSLAYLNTFYYPLPETCWILKYRCDIKFLQPMFTSTGSTIPVDERFLMGGETMIRGFRPYRIGPTFKGTKDPFGGISLQFYSVEFMRPIFSMLDVFAYADAGYLSLKQWDFGRPNMAVGVGARVRVFASGPPVMVGYGWPINWENSSQVKRFFFQIGTRF